MSRRRKFLPANMPRALTGCKPHDIAPEDSIAL